MPVDSIRLALVGAGMIANAGHIPAFRNLGEDVEIVAVYNRHLDRAQQTARRHDIPHAYDDMDRMLAERRPDLVIITTPNVSHRAYAEQAFAAGAHVLCEKPVAASYEDAVAMYDAARRAGRHLLVGQTGRFSGETVAAHSLAASGELGEMYYAETSMLRRRGVPKWGRFHIKEHSGGGPLYDLGVHALDALLWIMGNPKVVAVSGVTYLKIANQDEHLVTSLADSGAPLGVYEPRAYDPAEYDVEDMGAGLLRLADGGTINLKASWAANVPEGLGGTFIMGTRGGLRLNPLQLVRNLGAYQVDVAPKVPADPDIPFFGHWLQAEHVVRVLRGQEEPLVTQAEALNVMRALDGIYRSAEAGREIRFD